jgi:hypothetical protein
MDRWAARYGDAATFVCVGCAGPGLAVRATRRDARRRKREVAEGGGSGRAAANGGRGSVRRVAARLRLDAGPRARSRWAIECFRIRSHVGRATRDAAPQHTPPSSLPSQVQFGHELKLRTCINTFVQPEHGPKWGQLGCNGHVSSSFRLGFGRSIGHLFARSVRSLIRSPRLCLAARRASSHILVSRAVVRVPSRCDRALRVCAPDVLIVVCHVLVLNRSLAEGSSCSTAS